MVGGRGELDVDRPLARAGREVLERDVAVVLGAADDARRLVVDAQEVQEVVPQVAAVDADRAGRDLEVVAPRDAARQLGRRGPLEVDVELREGIPLASLRSALLTRSAGILPALTARLRLAHTSSTSGGAAGASPTAKAALQAHRGALGVLGAARVDDGQRPGARADVLAERRRRPSSPTAWSIGLVLAPSPAAELEHGDADLAHVDRVDVAALVGPDLLAVRGAREVLARALEQVRRAAERGDHRGEALGGGAGAQRLLGLRATLGAVVGQAGEREPLAAQRERDLEQPRLGVLAGRSAPRATRAPRPRCRPCGRGPGPCR